MPNAPDLVPFPTQGRRFSSRWRVRLGDTAPDGRLRLDALARYLQDVADDDAIDAGLDTSLSWVLRRTVVEVHRRPLLRERVELSTACTGTGPRWAERRTTLVGDRGASAEATALWVLLDGRGRPTRLPPAFHEVYAATAAGRTVSPRLSHPEPPAGADVGAVAFPLRRADLDVADHVNNAVYWQALEEHLADAPGAVRAEVEHRQALAPGATASVVVHGSVGDPDGLRLWVLDDVDGQMSVAATAWVTALSASTS